MTVKVEMVSLKDISPNPYRHAEKYKLSEEKLESLMQSYDNSGFWNGSLQGRRVNGKVEIAFGHHRIEAARRKKLKEVGIVVDNRSNADMLRMMADENREVFRNDAVVAVETIAAVIEAYGRGEIELEKVNNEGQRGGAHVGVRFAFMAIKAKPYTCLTVARFLGWTVVKGTQASPACREAFNAYHEMHAVQLAKKALPAENRSQVAIKSVVTAARTARKETERKWKGKVSDSKLREKADEAASKAAEIQIKSVKKTGGFEAREEAVAVGNRVVHGDFTPETKRIPDIEKYAEQLTVELDKFLHKDHALLDKINRVIDNIARPEVQCSARTGNLIRRAASQLAARATKVAERIDEAFQRRQTTVVPNMPALEHKERR